MLDSSACSRVSLLVVALGLVCTCCNSFLVPGGPHSSSSMTQRSVRGVSRLAKGGADRAARMMAGDLDVSLVCYLCCCRKKKTGESCRQPPPPPRRAFVGGVLTLQPFACFRVRSIHDRWVHTC